MTQVDRSTAQPGAGSPLAADERRELERLRHEVEDLRTAQAHPRRRFRWRSLLSAVLIVVGCVLTPVAGLAVWSHNQVSDTSRFVRTVSPLVDDPDIQNALTNRITATIFTYVDVKGLADDAVAALRQQGLPPRVADRLSGLTPTLASAVNGFVHDRVAQLVASPQFAQAFDRAVATAHKQMVSVLSGNSQAVVVRGGSVFLDLAPFIDLAKKRLSDAGLTAVSAVPEVHPTVKLTSADTLVRAQTAYSTLDTVASVLPWVVLLMFAVGVYLARRRYRALVGTGLGVALSIVVLAIGLLIARSMLVDAVPARAAPATASGFDILVNYLRLGMRALLVLALVVAVAGYLAGGSDTAVRIRRWSAGQLHRIRGGPAAGGPVATWVSGHVRGLRVGVVALAVLVFVFMKEPSGGQILILAVLLLLALAVVEFLARPAQQPAEPVAVDAGASVPPDVGPPPAPPAPRAPPSGEGEPERAPHP
ncbi:MAG TPA: hypothetical protein VGN47_02515 [Blastococcus sp.]|jgi:hypothetical protein|nr:hypothetical protein [Blastococcus sp.]